jgi:isopenicillin N synthase-like dioxygenase
MASSPSVNDASNPTSTLPIIDISPFLVPSSTPEARKATASAVNRACTDYGFFYLTGHGIPESKLDEVINLARRFFALPIDEKNKIKRHSAGGSEGGDGARGYQGIGENVTGGARDMHEAIDLYREWDHAEKDMGDGTCKTLQGTNLWPENPKELKPVCLEYIEQLQHVGEALVRAMGQALGLPTPETVASDPSSQEDSDIFVRNTDRSFWVMRLIGYPTLTIPLSQSAANGDSEPADESSFSCGVHSDYGCVTLLLADPTPGALQALHKDGSTWINADPIPGAFVVNIGDMIERWTNGLWKSTKHRVIHRRNGYRVSVPFFYEPNFEAEIKPLGKCVERSGEEPIHEGGMYGKHLMEKVTGNFY